MAPARRKRGAAAAAAAEAAAAQWRVGDLVLAKMKGFPAWPAMISEPEQWGLSSVKKKRLVYFYGTKQIAFCNYAELEAFTEEKKWSLLAKRQGKGADFVRAVDEIIDMYDSSKEHSDNKLDLLVNEVKPAERLADNNSNLDTEGQVNSSNMGSDKEFDAHSVTARGHDMISSDEPSVVVTGNERCVINSAPDEPTENISILDEMRNIPLSTSSFSKNKLSDANPQNCYTRSRAPSQRRSRSSLNIEIRKAHDCGKLLGEVSLASVDLVADNSKEDSTFHKYIENDKDDSRLHSRAPTFNQSRAPGFSSNNKKMISAANVDSACNSEASQNGASEMEFKSDGTSMNTTVIFKRKRKQIGKQVPHSADFMESNNDGELQAELGENSADSPNSRNELNKSDGDEHLPLVKRARVRMGRSQLEDSPVLVDEINVPNDKPELAVPADRCDMHGSPAIPGDGYSANHLSAVNAISNPSSKVDMNIQSGEGHPAWKNKEYRPKILTLDVEAALPPSKRLHRALEAMSANVAENINGRPEETRSKELILDGCVSSENSHSNKSADTQVASPSRSVIIRSPESSSTQFRHCPAAKRTSESVLQNNNVHAPASSPAEIKDDDRHMLTKGDVCEETQVGSKNTDCMLICNGAGNNIYRKASVLSMKLDDPPLDVTQNTPVPDRLSSSLGKTSGSEVTKAIGCNDETKPIGCPAYDIDKSADRCAEPVDQTKLILSDNNVTNDATSTSSLATKSSSIQSDADTRTFETRTFPALALKELNHGNLKDRCTSPDSMPMKELIAVAQARRFSRSIFFPDNFLNAKYVHETSASTPLKEGSQRQLSPSNQISRSTSMNDNVPSRSPLDGLQQRSLNKLAGHNEANDARRAFGSFLGSLTRTKESIARATRLAIDCAKHGIAGEAIDIIVERLEKESNLYKRVDLFFLVDSITQCSRNQKGGAGDVYPSLIQAVLPRLLYAAAPPGNSAWENRRQCLKVLKLWLERRTLPEYIICRHIKELEVINEASFGSSRRPSRTERALNDPLRDNEGMLVDEYGSNAGFHLPDLICTKVLEDDEESSSEDRSFDAVTPEHDAPGSDDIEESQMPVEKHRRILEDVDGELEMEDVAPSEAEVSTKCQPELSDTKFTSSDHRPSDTGPPLPDDMPPSPPPLPSSPPPVPPPPPVPVAQSTQLQPTLQPTSDPLGPHPPRATNNVQSQQPHSIAEHPGSRNPSIVPSQPASFCNSGYGVHPNPIPHNPPGPHGNFPAPPAPYHGNNYHQHSTVSVTNEGYHMQRPPPPPPPNQFPYARPEPNQRPQHWSNNCPSYPERYRYNGHDRDHHRHERMHHGQDRRHHFDDGGHRYDNRGHRYDDREHHFADRGHHFDERAIRGPVHHEAADRGRYPPFPRGPPIPDHFEAPPAPVHHGRPSDPPPGPCAGWSMTPRISNYSPSRHSIEPPPPVSNVSGAHGSWRPR